MLVSQLHTPMHIRAYAPVCMDKSILTRKRADSYVYAGAYVDVYVR